MWLLLQALSLWHHQCCGRSRQGQLPAFTPGLPHRPVGPRGLSVKGAVCLLPWWVPLDMLLVVHAYNTMSMRSSHHKLGSPVGAWHPNTHACWLTALLGLLRKD